MHVNGRSLRLMMDCLLNLRFRQIFKWFSQTVFYEKRAGFPLCLRGWWTHSALFYCCGCGDEHTRLNSLGRVIKDPANDSPFVYRASLRCTGSSCSLTKYRSLVDFIGFNSRRKSYSKINSSIAAKSIILTDGVNYFFSSSTVILIYGFL